MKRPKIKSMPKVHGDVTDAAFHKGYGIALNFNGIEFIIVSSSVSRVEAISKEIMYQNFPIQRDGIKPAGVCHADEITEY
jgi:hypothetical protein